jgi:7-carboxy-7-deazaguanine synthase
LNTPKGYIFEIFVSVQGEGIYLGERQLFVRTAGCSATCAWCDTVAAKKRRDYFVVHGRARRTIENPVTVARVIKESRALLRRGDRVRAVTITGGEPLEQPEFVAALARGLRETDLRVHLETSGIESGAIARVVGSVDVVAMDIKLPSATGKDHWDAHRDFLRVAARREAFVKVVVDRATSLAELDRAISLVAEIDTGIPLVLQPESADFLKEAHGSAARKRVASLLAAAQRSALGRLGDVRVIPQCHKLLKVR